MVLIPARAMGLGSLSAPSLPSVSGAAEVEVSVVVVVGAKRIRAFEVFFWRKE